ncbi:hemerythrin domain-containing protein [Streptomyces sp. NPDC051217]|uniref:hemerythrin domain-containing protein n=1 Tax=Streptomyces sp. NPDC051217 TaxID=3365644 RepID=UPI00378E1476
MSKQTGRADVRDMLVVHQAFRDSYSSAPGLVRGVAAGDTRRAATVADHLKLIADFLHLHHKGEDDLLWPKLKERAPADLWPALEVLEAQHVEIDLLVNKSTALRTSWRRTAGVDEGEELAVVLSRLNEGLTEHLALEEDKVLSRVSQYMTDAEWHELGDHAINGLPKSKLPIVFGMLADIAEPEVVDLMLASAPRVPRFLMPRLGPLAYRAHVKKVYGGTPALTRKV